MTSLRVLAARIAAWLGLRHRDADLDDEIRTHLEYLADAYREQGMSPEGALAAARRDLGGVAHITEDYRDQRGWPALAALGQDARDAVRTLRRHRAFTAGTLAVLASALAVNSAVFSLVNAVLLRPLPVARPSELVYVIPTGPFTGASFDDYQSLVGTPDLFSTALATAGDISAVRDGATVRDVRGEEVSANYFDVLEVGPAMGRAFGRDGKSASQRDAPVVISWRLWQTYFHGAADVLGKRLDLQLGWRSSGYYGPSKPYTVIGVMPSGFRGMGSPWDPTDYWVPITNRAPDRWVDVPDGTPGKPADPVGSAPTIVVGRLRPGVPIARARREIEAFGERLRRQEYSRSPVWGLTLTESRTTPLPFDPKGTIVPSRFGAALLAVAALVLTVAIANMVGLLMARGAARRQEMAVRLTLGAGRFRIVRSVLFESLFLTIAAGGLGVLASRWLVGLVVSRTPAQYVVFDVHRVALDVPVDWRVLAFSFVTCLVTGLATGSAPAREAARTDLSAILGDGANATARHTPRRLRHWIVVPQVAASLVLLVVAGLLIGSLWRTERKPNGYEAEAVVMLSIERPRPAHVEEFTPADRAARNVSLRDDNRRLLARVESVRDVSAASLLDSASVEGLPMASGRGWIVSRDGFDAGTHAWVSHTAVSPGYFDVLRIPLRSGRRFDRRDGFGAPKVVVIDELLAERLWPAANPIGQSLAFHEPKSTTAPDWLEVVGVVGSVKLPLSERPEPALYLPLDQSSSQYPTTVIARSRAASGPIVSELTDAISKADPTVLISGTRSLDQAIDSQLFTRHFSLALVGGAGLLGLLLAAVGLYGVISYSVVVRLRELGIRAALGAARSDIARLVIKEGLVVILAGCGLGLPVAAIVVRLTTGFVVALPPLDAATCAGAVALIVAVVLSSCAMPALRAARTDPMKVLRQL